MTNTSFLKKSLNNQSFGRFEDYLKYLGLGLIGASVLYLIASNWFWFDKAIKLALPMGFLVLCGLISSFIKLSDGLHKAVDSLAGLALGLCLAVIGQVYQTGADSFWLFGIWSVLLLPWLYRMNEGVFGLLMGVSNLAIWLFGQQVLPDDMMWYLLFAFVLNALWLAVVMYRYVFWRYVMAIWLGGLSCISAVVFGDESFGVAHLVYALTWVVLPVVGLVHYRKKDAMMTVLLASGLGWSLLCYLAVQLSWHGGGLFLTLATVSFGVFLFIGNIILRLFPNHGLHRVPMAVGAWLAGWLLVAFMVVASDFDTTGMTIMGLFLWVGAFLGLKDARLDFVRQLSYCLLLAGQVMILIGVYDWVDGFGLPIMVQMIALGVVWVFRERLHWVVLMVQTLGLYGLVLAASADAWGLFWDDSQQLFGLDELITAIFALGLLWCHRASMGLSLLVVLIGYACDRLTFINNEIMHDMLMVYIIQTFWVLVVVKLGVSFQNNSFQNKLPNNKLLSKEQLIFGVLGVLLTWLGYWHIFVLIVGLMMACRTQDKLYQGLYAIGLVGLLGFIYYDLSVSFIIKALSMAVSGVVLFGVGVALQKISDVQKYQGVAHD